MHFGKRAWLALMATVSLLLGVSPMAIAQSEVASQQQAAFKQYGLSKAQIKGIVIDSALTRTQALGSVDGASPEVRVIHAKMTTGHDPVTGKRLLEVLPVVYHGYDGKVHLGQVVVHSFAVTKFAKMFLTMWRLNFPIYSAIPQSQFGYDDQASMAANNTMVYRPEPGSEHWLGFTGDYNPKQNPFDRTKYQNPQPIEPPGAVYDPTAKGTILEDSQLRREFTKAGFEWGGGWGNPETVPSTDFWRVGFFDYMHIQPDYTWYEESYRHVPADLAVMARAQSKPNEN